MNEEMQRKPQNMKESAVEEPIHKKTLSIANGSGSSGERKDGSSWIIDTTREKWMPEELSSI